MRYYCVLLSIEIYCNSIVKKKKAGKINEDRALDLISPTERDNIERMVYWTLAWPISFVESFLGNIIDIAETLLTKVFKGTFAKIANNAADEIKNS